MKSRFVHFLAGCAFLTGVVMMNAADVSAQGVRFPAPSQAATVKQTVGVTDVTIVYSRPGVKGREIWGKVVPYNEIWRAGANLSTMLEVSEDVKIEGQKVPAGKYSIFMIPAQTGDWTLVINKAVLIGGTNGYKQEEDVFRAKVKPQMMTTSQEWLAYTVDDLTDSTATIALVWEKARIPFKIEAATAELAFGKARTAVANAQAANIGFANYALQTNSNIDEAMKMVESSIAVQETYRNQVLKARIFERKGNKAEAVKSMTKAIELGKAAKTAPFDLADNEKLLATWKTSK
jgi:hypothetical protein